MKLHLLEALIDRFIANELRSGSAKWHFPHSLVHHFHQSWKMSDPASLSSVYNQSMRSEISQRWWKRERYRPKEMMLFMMDADPELATIAWKDLANESLSLDGRLDRFNFYCEDLMLIHRKKHPLASESHHHQDAAVISLYLAGMYPDKYVLYPGLEAFSEFCGAVASPQRPAVDDYVRYVKVAGIVNAYLRKSPELDKLIPQRHGGNVSFIQNQLAYEVIKTGTE